MTRFNVCLVQPDNYIHSYAFLELGELLHFSLQELGYDSSFGFNNPDPNATNILIGCHLLDPKFIPQLPSSTILLNTEQIYGETDWNKPIFAWAKHFQIWDYSPKNIEKFAKFLNDLINLPSSSAYSFSTKLIGIFPCSPSFESALRFKISTFR